MNRFIPQRPSWRALWVLSFALLLCGGCSFNRAWRTAAQTPVAEESIAGRWEGRWLSDANGHTGKLRCVLTQTSDATYNARFHATYWKIFRYSYAVDLQFEKRETDLWIFQGSEDLGFFAGGVYHYTGSVSSTNFHSTYRSKYDHGTFQMNRPQ